MLPPQLANNPAGAAAYVRQMIQADEQAIHRGEIPDKIEQISHNHFDLDEDVVYKMLVVMRDYYEKKKGFLQKKLISIIN